MTVGAPAAVAAESTDGATVIDACWTAGAIATAETVADAGADVVEPNLTVGAIDAVAEEAIAVSESDPKRTVGAIAELAELDTDGDSTSEA